MSSRTDCEAVLVSTGISIVRCESPSCDCSGVFIQLVDAEGSVFAVAPLTPETARAVAQQLLQAAQTH